MLFLQQKKMPKGFAAKDVQIFSEKRMRGKNLGGICVKGADIFLPQ